MPVMSRSIWENPSVDADERAKSITGCDCVMSDVSILMSEIVTRRTWFTSNRIGDIGVPSMDPPMIDTSTSESRQKIP